MLSKKIAIITGSGRGIGRAAAILLANEGAKVIVNDIDPEPAEETVERIRAVGGEAKAHIGSVSDEDFASDIIETAVNSWGGVHIIINNAGFTWDTLLHKSTDEQWNTILDIHLTAPFRLIRAAKPYFCDAAKLEIQEGKNVSRKIINISSLAGLSGNVGQSNYSAAKAGIVGFTKTIAKEWAGYNVQANAVAFGLIDTRLTQAKENAEAMGGVDEKIALGIPDTQRRSFIKMIPMGRAGTPMEAASAILFFASDLSNYVTGQCLTVSGGL